MKPGWFGSLPHYIDHLAPIWRAMPAEARGPFFVPDALVAHAQARGVNAHAGGRPHPDWPLTIVSAFADLAKLRRDQRAILVEHGAGQTYFADPKGRHGGWAGGDGRDRVDLFLCPNQHVADANEAAYPHARSVLVGCPKIDRWIPSGTPTLARHRNEGDLQPTVAVSFRWDCRLCPEARTAWPHYAAHLRTLTEGEWHVIGHGHPRALYPGSDLTRSYLQAGIEIVPDFDQVLERADVYLCDNSSTAYEAAAAGLPVITLNAPWYRRDMNHGLRFWDAVPGLQVDDFHELPNRIRTVLAGSAEDSVRRTRAAKQAFTYVDGTATARAVEAILDHLERASAPLTEVGG